MRRTSVKSTEVRRFAAAAQMLHTLGKREHLQVIMKLLGGPTTVGDIARSLSASRLLVARDLTTLYHAGLVRRSVDGARTLYELNGASVGEVVLAAVRLAHASVHGEGRK
jgi:DNA-binding transcriptional ArsR family regulator